MEGELLEGQLAKRRDERRTEGETLVTKRRGELSLREEQAARRGGGERKGKWGAGVGDRGSIGCPPEWDCL